ncbi:lytic transglycosylase domain-containing protein [Sodalis sp. dw_96]|uniref:lytic transglycosylase domain-containing protein n=1 Tax=Sodalis sp. dw_96 TaxID=2719794 RepID=UPI001BD63B74|nr:lytic transglycosylase domain-containing protein [Sodalis sp. dw_96]
MQQYYGPVWQAQQLNDDVNKIRVQPPAYNSQSNGGGQGGNLFPQLEAKYQLPSGLLNRVYQAESGGGRHLYSPKGAEGPFQFMPETGAQYGLNNREDRLNLNKSSEAAAHLLSDLLIRYQGDVAKAVAAYNEGGQNVDKYGLARMPAETRNYLDKV